MASFAWGTFSELGANYDANWKKYLERLERYGLHRTAGMKPADGKVKIRVLYFMNNLLKKLLFDVRFAHGSFIAVGGDVVDSECVILTSSDGASWTPEIVNIGGGLRGIAYGQDTFVVVGQGLSETSVPVILTSTDGVGWTQKAPGSGSALLGIAFGGDTSSPWARTGPFSNLIRFPRVRYVEGGCFLDLSLSKRFNPCVIN